MTTIAIVGQNHCGSTILSRLLATGPVAWCGGELHWLLDAKPGQVIKVAAGWDLKRACAVHGEACPVLTKSFLDRVDLAAPTLYVAVKAQSGRTVLVSSDKFPSIYRRFLKPSEDVFGIVLFKDPLAAFLSQVTTNKQTSKWAIKNYVTIYSEVLAWAPAFFSRLVWIACDDLIDHTTETLARIQTALRVDLRLTGALASDYCSLGGNAPAHGRSEMFRPGELTRKVQQAELGDPTFFDLVQADRESWKIYEELTRRAKLFSCASF